MATFSTHTHSHFMIACVVIYNSFWLCCCCLVGKQDKRINCSTALNHSYLSEGRARYHSCMCKCCKTIGEVRSFCLMSRVSPRVEPLSGVLGPLTNRLGVRILGLRQTPVALHRHLDIFPLIPNSEHTPIPHISRYSVSEIYPLPFRLVTSLQLIDLPS